MSEKYVLVDYVPQTEFGRELERIVENGDNSDATIYWLVNRVEELEKARQKIEFEAHDQWARAQNLDVKNQRYKQWLEDIRDISTGSVHEFAVKALKGE